MQWLLSIVSCVLAGMRQPASHSFLFLFLPCARIGWGSPWGNRITGYRTVSSRVAFTETNSATHPLGPTPSVRAFGRNWLKACVKSNGTAPVRGRWKFSDDALGFSDMLPKLWRTVITWWLDWRSSITFDTGLNTHYLYGIISLPSFHFHFLHCFSRIHYIAMGKNRIPDMIGVNSFMLLISWVFVSMRCYCRIFIVKSFGLDDYFCLLAQVRWFPSKRGHIAPWLTQRSFFSPSPVPSHWLVWRMALANQQLIFSLHRTFQSSSR